MIDRRVLLALGMSVVVMPASLARAGQRPKIGFVSAVQRNAEHFAAFEAGLRESGLEPDRQLEILERYADGDLATVRRQIDELAGLGIAVFVTAGDNAMRLIRERAPKVPIVVAVLGNYGNVVLGGSISRPPGNVTGFANLSAELAAKQLDMLREIAPGLNSVAMLVNPNIANPTGQPDAYHNAAQSLGMTIRTLSVRPGMDLVAALREAKIAGAQGVVVYRNFLFETMQVEIAAAIAAVGLPSMFEERFYVDMGGLISYSTNLADLFRRSGSYVAKILAGTSPSELPVQLPSKFELVVNLKTAKTLGLEIPPSILLRADEVIE